MSADFGAAEYAWADMKDYYYFSGGYSNVYARNVGQEGALATDAQCEAVARLIYDIGVALEMSYANSGSSANTGDVTSVLARYFDYDDSMRQLYRDYYYGNWDDLLRSELDQRRPLLYRGQSDEGGHAFVIDGYDSEGYFHVNWGWGGASDGYFVSSVLNPDEQGAGGSAGGFSSWQAAIIGLQPNTSGTVLATGVSIDPASAALALGQTAMLNARVQPGNVSNAALNWHSSNTAVATVDDGGNVTARGVGTAIITATTTDGSNLSATCAVTVMQPVTSIALDRTELDLAAGDNAVLTATVLPADATNPALKWSTSNPSVALVSNGGVILAKAVGQTTITVSTTDGSNLSATCAVNVKSKPEVPATISVPELTIATAQAGRLFTLPLTMTMPAGADFTNIELHVTFPDGLRPAVDVDGVYGYEGTDIPFRGRTPVVSYSDNMDDAGNWPDRYVIVGANISLTPVTAIPCQLYTLNVAADAGFEPGDRPMLVYVKYNDSANKSHTIGSNGSRVLLTTIHFVDGLAGDVDGDGRVDIYDLNALVNIILEASPRSDYAGNANIDGDADDRVDINDVNALVNIILAQ